jgi:cold shock CspA family protein
MRGVVKMWNEARGFGFITTEEKKDYFVHRFALGNAQSLVYGDVVEFDEMTVEVNGKPATRAINVWVLEVVT